MSDELDKKRSPFVVLAVVVSILLLGFGIWAQVQYSQGHDPFAELSSLFVTVEADQEDAAIEPAANEDTDDTSAETEEDGTQQEDASVSSEGAQADSNTSSSSASGSSTHSSNGSSSSQKPSQEPAPATKISVSITIDPGATGIAGGSAQLVLDPGATVYDALMSCGVSVNAQETAMGVYVAAINGLAERDYGPTSGWMYSVNGSSPQHACNYHELSDGDAIVWRYVNVEK